MTSYHPASNEMVDQWYLSLKWSQLRSQTLTHKWQATAPIWIVCQYQLFHNQNMWPIETTMLIARPITKIKPCKEWRHGKPLTYVHCSLKSCYHIMLSTDLLNLHCNAYTPDNTMVFIKVHTCLTLPWMESKLQCCAYIYLTRSSINHVKNESSLSGGLSIYTSTVTTTAGCFSPCIGVHSRILCIVWCSASIKRADWC